ncbi:alpha/beta fold hydrolase [Rossellomorea marisflavi]|uniref:alpha/beta fold hydrolase n=1 Tax=Rossellomorea marisflavi TaxID=189381 RepID=UPI003D2EEE78
MKEQVIHIDGYRVRINTWGETYLPTIVCLHGLGNSSLSFIEIGEELKSVYHMVSIDLPGHGGSEAFKSQEYSMTGMVGWLHGVLADLGVSRFYFLAHSYGADIALHYMKEYGSSVIRTILIDGGYTTKKSFYEIVDGLAQNLDWKWPNINSVEKEVHYTSESFSVFEYPNVKAFLENEEAKASEWSALKRKASEDYVKEVDGKIKLIATPEVATAAIRSMAQSPIRDLYQELDSEKITLLVATLPEEFSVINEGLLEDVKRLSDITIKYIEDTTHMLHWDDREAVLGEIRLKFK